MRIIAVFNEIGFSGILDIILMTFLIYMVLVWFKKTRAAFVLTGIIIVAAFYLIARQFNLFLTASVFQGFFAVILVAVVVIFQEELRHFFEKVAVIGLRPKFKRKKTASPSKEVVATLARTLTELAREKIGALIVIKGKDTIGRHLQGGEELNGQLSEALLKSLFDPHSDGHDGAIIIEGNIIKRFACHLPLSKNFKSLGSRGTRHAAGLGLSELTDALCIVVSEEKGTIYCMRLSEMRKVSNSEELGSLIDNFYKEISPEVKTKRIGDVFKKNSKEKAIALSIALFLWFLQVYGSKIVYKSFSISVEHAGLPIEYTIAEIDPKEVYVTLSGPRRSFYFLDKNRIKLILKIWQMKEGARIARISSSNFSVPKNMEIENIEPTKVNVRIEKKENNSKK